MDRREELLDECLKIFNREGATPLSIRGLADMLEMSDGNLRYHFKSKEEIYLALFDRLKAEIETWKERYKPGASTTIISLRTSIKMRYEIMFRYRFIFAEQPLLNDNNPELKKRFNAQQKAQRQLFLEGFQILRDEKYFSKNFDDEQYEMLCEQLFIVNENWLHYLPKRVGQERLEEYIEKYTDIAVALFIPYLNF